MKIEVEKLIDASCDRTFAIVSDIPRWPETISAIDRIEMLTPGPVGAGTRFRETRQMYGREATEEMTVSEFVAPWTFVLTAENHGARYRAVHTLTPEGNGTRLALSFAGEAVTMTAKLLLPVSYLLRNSVMRQLEADLDDIKRAAGGPSTRA